MNNIELLIDTNDESFGGNLARALALKDSLFTSRLRSADLGAESSNQIDSQTDDFDLMITDKTETAQECKKDKKPFVFLDCKPGNQALDQSPDQALDKSTDHKVFIYSGLEVIAEKLYQVAEVENDLRINRQSTDRSHILCVTSGAGGVGCSAVAIGLGKELALGLKQKVLYISFENIPSTSLYFSDLGGRGTVNEYIYHCFKDKASMLNPEAYLIDDLQGLKAFRPGQVDNQLLSLSKEEISPILRDLAYNGGFNIIILDIPGHVPVFTRDFFDSLSRLILVDDGKPLSLFKNLKWMDKWKNDMDKTTFVTNKWDGRKDEFEYDPSSQVCEGELEKAYIEYDPHSFKSGKIDINRRFGIGIRRLADELADKL